MNLLSDIKKGVIESDTKIDSILRLCKILACNLGNKDFESWINFELNGYSVNDKIPDYRIIHANIIGDFYDYFGRPFKNAPIRSSIFPKEMRDITETVPLYQSIIEIDDFATNKISESIYFSIPIDFIIRYANEMYVDMYCLCANRVVTKTSMLGVVGKVKNLILGFVMLIEKENPNIDYNYNKNKPIPDERITVIFNQTFNAPINNLAQNSSNFSQNITNNIQQGDFESLKNYLQEIGIDDNDIEELKNAIEKDDKPIENQKLGENTSKWFGVIMSKAVSGVYKISYEILPKLIFTGIDHYYGLM